MSSRRRQLPFGVLCSFALIAGLFLALLPASGAPAHPYGGNSGAFARLQTSYTSQYDLTLVDGLYAQAVTTSNMDVPLSGGTPGVFPNGQAVLGANARPISIPAWDPIELRNNAFIGMGYAAGCVRGICTGLTNGGVTKKFYLDGRWCTPACDYYLFFYSPGISAGTVHAYQIQRKYLNGQYRWLAYFDNQLYADFRNDMWNGTGALGVESGGEPSGQPLNMTQDDYRHIHYHLNGWASNSPPGLTNYRNIEWASTINPHAPACRMIRYYTNYDINTLEGTGRC